MPSTFFGLNIGASGLYTYQAALNTTFHNISNIETKGYTRQVMGQKAGVPQRVNNTYGMAGTGVVVTGVQQIRDEYYDIKFWKNQTILGNYEKKDYYMKNIQSYFNEFNVRGYVESSNAMNNSLQGLSTDPSSLTKRTEVNNYAKSVTEYFNYMATSLEGIQEQANFEVKNQVSRINSIASQIAALVKQINILESNGGTANDLRDERALLIDELSTIADVSVSEFNVGDGVGVTTYEVKLNGNTLVDSTEYNTLKVVPREEKVNETDIDGLYDIVWNSGQTFHGRSALLGGSLKAILEVRDGNNLENFKGKATGVEGTNTITVDDSNINAIEKLNIAREGILTVGNKTYAYDGFEVIYDASGKATYTFTLKEALTEDVSGNASIGESINYKGIPHYMAQLNELVRTYARRFNEVHKQGEDLSGNRGLDYFNGTHPTTGDNYIFDDTIANGYYNLTAKNFTINSEVMKDPTKLALAKKVVDGVEDKGNLDELMALANDKNMFKQGTPASFLHALVGEVGVDAKKAEDFAKSQEDILHMIQNQRLSISGVDMEEEGMYLVRFQHAWNLSAKVISVMDEICNKLINEMAV